MEKELKDDILHRFPDEQPNFNLGINNNLADLTFSTLNNGVFLLNDGINGESGTA